MGPCWAAPGGIFDVRVGFIQDICEGNTCPDIHLSSLPTSTHPLLFWYSPTKHHCVLPLVIDFCMAFDDSSGRGSFRPFNSNGEKWTAFLRSSGVFALLASINRFPTDCMVPSAISIPVFVVSLTASAVVLISDPVVYPKIDNTCKTNGFTIFTPDSKTPPKIESKFIPKREKINKTNRITINAFCMFNTPKIFVGPEPDSITLEGAEGACAVSIIIYNYIYFVKTDVTHIKSCRTSATNTRRFV